MTSLWLWWWQPLVCCLYCCVLSLPSLLSSYANIHSEFLCLICVSCSHLEGEKGPGSSVFPATFYFAKQIADPPSPPPRIRLWIYAYVVFVCVFLKLQIFIKTASMLELTMLHIQEQACIPHQSVIPKEQCQLISHCCSKTHGWKQRTGEMVCFGLPFGI